MLKNLIKGNLPVGIITSSEQFQKMMQEISSENFEIVDLAEDSTIDDIKEFRKKLLQPTLTRKIAVIQRLDKFSDAKQAVLLKIFETNLEDVSIIFHAAYLPNYTIETRSKIYFISSQKTNEEVSQMMEKILVAMKNGTLDESLSAKWSVFIRAESLQMDGIISENEKNTILKGLQE